MQAVYQGEGWLGVGFSDSGSMPGSDAVIGLPDDNTALEYDMPNYLAPLEAADQVPDEAGLFYSLRTPRKDDYFICLFDDSKQEWVSCTLCCHL